MKKQTQANRTQQQPWPLACLSYSFSAGMLGASLELVQGSSRPCGTSHHKDSWKGTANIVFCPHCAQLCTINCHRQPSTALALMKGVSAVGRSSSNTRKAAASCDVCVWGGVQVQSS